MESTRLRPSIQPCELRAPLRLVLKPAQPRTSGSQHRGSEPPGRTAGPPLPSGVPPTCWAPLCPVPEPSRSLTPDSPPVPAGSPLGPRHQRPAPRPPAAPQQPRCRPAPRRPQRAARPQAAEPTRSLRAYRASRAALHPSAANTPPSAAPGFPRCHKAHARGPAPRRHAPRPPRAAEPRCARCPNARRPRAAPHGGWGGEGALTARPQQRRSPRLPPPALTSVTCPGAQRRRRPPIYCAPAPPPGPPFLSSPIGRRRARSPAPPPVRRSDWLTAPPLRGPPASKHAPTALPFVERFYWLVRLQEVRGDWLAEGRPLK